MWDFFWLTLVAGVLGLFYSFSKGESDGFEIAKVIYAGIVMIILLVIWFNTGEDAIGNDKKIELLDNPYLEHPLPDGRPNYFPEPIEMGPAKNEDKNRFIQGER